MHSASRNANTIAMIADARSRGVHMASFPEWAGFPAGIGGSEAMR